MKTAWLSLVALVGCSSARGRVVAPRPAHAVAAATDEATANVRATWERVAPRDRPSRIDDVAALADGSAVILSGNDVLRVRASGEVTRACAVDANLVVNGLHATRDGWWLLAGAAFEPMVWRSEGCARVALPPLVTRDAPPGTLRSAQSGGDAVAWSSDGAMLRSRDGAITWQRIPSLPEVVAVAANGTTLYAAALLTSVNGRSPFDAHSYEVYALAEGATRWAPAATPGDRAAPVALLPREGGGVVGLDALGGFELTAEGVGRVGPATGPHFARDRPQALFAATAGAAVGLSDRLFFEQRLSGRRMLPALPDARAPVSFDAAPDGALLVSDGHDLWRVRAGAETETILRSPLGGGRPALLAASGAVIAAFTDRAQLAVSRDGGATWTTQALALDRRESARSLSVLADGTVALVVAGAHERETGALWIADPTLHSIELPRGAHIIEYGAAALRAIRDRWVLAAGDVFVSDDQGARWRRTLAAPGGSEQSWSVFALVTAPVGLTAYALDSDGTLWRSDDAGDQFVALASEHTHRTPTNGVPTRTNDWLQWDGGDTLLAEVHYELVRFDREGREELRARVGSMQAGAAVEGGAIVASYAGAVAHHVSDCSRDGSVLMAVSREGRPLPVADACAHVGVAFAVDGDLLYVADPDGAIDRTSLRALWRDLGAP